MFPEHQIMTRMALVLLSTGAWCAPLGGNDLSPVVPVPSNHWVPPASAGEAGPARAVSAANRNAGAPLRGYPAFRETAHDAALAAAAAAAAAGTIKLSLRADSTSTPAPDTTAATSRSRKTPTAYQRMLRTLVCQRSSHPKLCDDMLPLRVSPVANPRKITGVVSKDTDPKIDVDPEDGGKTDQIQDSNSHNQKRSRKRKTNSYRGKANNKLLKKVISNTNEILRSSHLTRPVLQPEEVTEPIQLTDKNSDIQIQDMPEENLKGVFKNIEVEVSPSEKIELKTNNPDKGLLDNPLLNVEENLITDTLAHSSEVSTIKTTHTNLEYDKTISLSTQSGDKNVEGENQTSTAKTTFQMRVENYKAEYPKSSAREESHNQNLVDSTTTHPLPDGYLLVAGVGAYKLHEQRRTWPAARAVCDREGGHLVVINSEREAEALRTIMRQHSPYLKYVLVGFHDVSKEGHYVTLTGTSLREAGYEKWKLNEPNGYGGNEDCGSMNPEAEFNDIFCDRPWQYMCEIEIRN